MSMYYSLYISCHLEWSKSIDIWIFWLVKMSMVKKDCNVTQVDSNKYYVLFEREFEKYRVNEWLK